MVCGEPANGLRLSACIGKPRKKPERMLGRVREERTEAAGKKATAPGSGPCAPCTQSWHSIADVVPEASVGAVECEGIAIRRLLTVDDERGVRDGRAEEGRGEETGVSRSTSARPVEKRDLAQGEHAGAHDASLTVAESTIKISRQLPPTDPQHLSLPHHFARSPCAFSCSCSLFRVHEPMTLELREARSS